MTISDISIYIYKVLQAVAYAHKNGIMHRDIKPGNIMWSQRTKNVSLIDWGLADFYVPDSDYIVRVATKHYKSPELLLGYKKYTPTLDIWCIGCTLAGLVFSRIPYFKGKDNDDQIERMCEIFGGRVMIDYINKYNIEISQSVINNISQMSKRPWSSFKSRYHLSPDLIDLLSRLLTIDHMERPSAEEAMNHPFFKDIHNKI